MNKYVASLLLLPSVLLAQDRNVALPDGWAADPPVLDSLITFARGESELRVAVIRYVADKAAIERRYQVRYSPRRLDRLRQHYAGWDRQLGAVDFDALNPEGQIDYIALRNRIAYDQEMLRLDAERGEQIAPLIPFGDSLRLLQEERHDRERVEPRSAAETLNTVAKQIALLTGAVIEDGENAASERGVTPVVEWRAANQIEHLRAVLADWNKFYSGYDPMFNFWVPEPYGRVDEALQAYASAINRHVIGIQPNEKAPIIGDPVLQEGLRADLAVEMIPYTAEEIIRIGEREFEWTEEQFRIVANDMGYGDDWLAALEHTKNLAPPPGEKPWLIFEIGEFSEQVHRRDEHDHHAATLAGDLASGDADAGATAHSIRSLPAGRSRESPIRRARWPMRTR